MSVQITKKRRFLKSSDKICEFSKEVFTSSCFFPVSKYGVLLKCLCFELAFADDAYSVRFDSLPVFSWNRPVFAFLQRVPSLVGQTAIGATK